MSWPAAALAAPSIPLHLNVDASDAIRGIIHVHESLPAAAGPLTLVYPKWIPGEHAPDGPIQNVVTVAISSGGKTLPWTRDLVDYYAYHVNVPAATPSLDVSFDYLGSAAGTTGRLTTPNLLALKWSTVVLYPLVANVDAIEVSPELTLPGADWQYGTALETAAHTGARVTFKPVTLEMLVDSPLDAGINAKRWHLGEIDGAPVDLAAFADTPEELEPSEKTLAHLHNLISEMAALYGARHFAHYTFLLTCSDVMPGVGIEHHQSSDDGASGDYLSDEATFNRGADLLSHEFNHSWDGKYRRPDDLATPNFQVPMKDDGLWVYEGMTQFYGELQAERSGATTRERWLQDLATTWAYYDAMPARLTRPLLDTATAAPLTYSNREWVSARRSADYYSESALMWLTADVMIRKMSGGKKSLDDLAREFFGQKDTGAEVVTYTRADVIQAMNAVQPYDWAAFFKKWVDDVAPHPANPFEGAGWRVVFTAKMSEDERSQNARRRRVDVRYSLGLAASNDGTISDVVPGSPAAKAGIGPGMKLVAIDSRAVEELSDELDPALTRAQKTHAPLRLLMLSGRVYREMTVPYFDGPRHPHLERVPNEPDVLSPIAEPRRAKAA